MNKAKSFSKNKLALSIDFLSTTVASQFSFAQSAHAIEEIAVFGRNTDGRRSPFCQRRLRR